MRVWGSLSAMRARVRTSASVQCSAVIASERRARRAACWASGEVVWGGFLGRAGGGWEGAQATARDTEKNNNTNKIK